ncbi:hypothetical protein [Roseisolibacter agri]|uniref:Uncharacterized protein n=1 Tax=Roseisolibacter agri TaxID=2014610 RepID=A0AA37QEY0_9BACT|nr:hypothetical protein [Roseisolibacter agri]GLC25533.1 hypothetical protein rosag_20460 [Roseisolibacter agri]
MKHDNDHGHSQPTLNSPAEAVLWPIPRPPVPPPRPKRPRGLPEGCPRLLTFEETRAADVFCSLFDDDDTKGDAHFVRAARAKKSFAELVFWNDATRSLTITGPAGTCITLYDSPKGKTDDDFVIVIKTDDAKRSIGQLEITPVASWVRRTGLLLWYSGGNGLNGKVSSMRLHGPWW